MNQFNFLRRAGTFGLASALILHSAISVADDTEVFFGGPQSSQGIKPNVLFLLDNSGSMAWRLDSDSTNLNGTPSRISVLRDSFHDIITNTSGINVGVMVLNSRADYGNGRTVYPVEYIDGPVGVKIAATPEILVSADDASRTNAATTTDVSSPTLVMGGVAGHVGGTITRSLGSPNTYSNDNSSYYIKSDYSCSVKIATVRDYCDTGAKSTLNARSGTSGQSGLFLFRNLNIPAGATITSATLTVTPSTTNNTKPGINVRLENSKTPAAYNDATTISDRTFVSTDLTGNSTVTGTAKLPTANWTANSPFVINIADEIRAQLNNIAPTADPISDLGLQLRATTDRTYNYYVGDHASAPTLTITYTAPAPASRSTGLRFQNVGVPRGATITSARIDFVPAGSNDEPVTFDVSAENTGSANSFTAGENFTARASRTVKKAWTPDAWRTENPPTYVEGPTVLDQVQTVVNNSAWCGNNPMAFFFEPTAGSGNRTTYSQDGSSTLKPVLRITYEGGEGGCLKPQFETRITAPKNDARQTGSTVTVSESTISLNNTSSTSSPTYVAARYESMPVVRNATVEKAELIITRASGSEAATVDVSVQNIGNSADLTTSNNNISNRTTTGNFSCSLSGTQTICENSALTTALQNVFSRSDWTDGNALTVILKSTAKKNYVISAYDSSPGDSIKLKLKLGNGGMGNNYRTVRTHVDNLVSGMTASGGTPIVPSMHEAALYLSQKYHQGANTSPITSACQATHLVVLTDGKPEGTDSSVQSDIASKAGSCANVTNLSDAKCGVELAKWLATSDQSTFDGDNFINTHTVGFALNARPGAEGTAIRKFLADMATAGGGGSYSAENATDLSKAFNQILQQVLATDTTFVSATAPVNTFNRQDHKDELYFSLFRPSNTDRWAGNLKRYRMKTNASTAWIVDRDDLPAIDINTGLFRSDARSWWSATNDGNSVTEGGAARRITDPNNRNLLTNASGNTLSAIKTSNVALTYDMLGASASGDERANLITYIRGYDPNDNSTVRQALGDPIHATPSVVSYGCADTNCTSEKQAAIVGTNEGFVHLFDTNTGDEQSAFMPKELLPNIKRLRANAATGSQSHIYGMDNSVTVWTNDADGNGSISGSDEFAYAYASMGRGGRSLYALNVTNPSSPSLMWSIQGGVTNGFSRLGQTWSAPVRAKIRVGTTITNVLIFGGGYDPAQDSNTTRTADAQGNDLYIVNATTGALLWSASAAGVNMHYSVPSKVKITTLATDSSGTPQLNSDKLAEQIFVGDMGGQVWRFRINNGSSGTNLASGSMFASVSGSTAADNRRFYHEPELALVSVNNQLNLTVNIGSGFRGHPLNKVIDDRFYSFRTSVLDGTSATLTESSLYDGTSLVTATAEQQEVLLERSGWYIRLTRSGEKVMSNALAIGGVLYFNTYEPKTNQNSCNATQGVSYSYRVSLLDSTAINASRYTTTKGASLPSNPQLFCKGDICYAYNDPSQLTNVNGPGGGNGGSDCAADAACPNDVSAQARLYWADEED